MTRKSHGEAVARVVIEQSRIDIVPLTGLSDGQLLYANSVRDTTSDRDPSLRVEFLSENPLLKEG